MVASPYGSQSEAKQFKLKFSEKVQLEFFVSNRLPYCKAYSDHVKFPSGCLQL